MSEVTTKFIVEEFESAEHDPRKLVVEFEEVFLLDRLGKAQLRLP